MKKCNTDKAQHEMSALQKKVRHDASTTQSNTRKGAT